MGVCVSLVVSSFVFHWHFLLTVVLWEIPIIAIEEE